MLLNGGGRALPTWPVLRAVVGCKEWCLASRDECWEVSVAGVG